MKIERCILTSDSGTRIPSVLITTANPVGAVVIVHGYGGSKEEQLGLAWRVAELGLAVCAIDLRGHGEHALPMDHDVQADVETAITYCRHFGKVAAIGHSLGGWLSLHSTADLAIAISPALSNDYGQQTRSVLDSMRSYRVHDHNALEVNLELLASQPQWLPEPSRPALLIYGTRDVPEIVAACAGLKEQGAPVIEIEQALHSDIYLLEPTFYAVSSQLQAWFTITGAHRGRKAPSVIIERATVDDVEAILALQKKAYQSEAAIYNNFRIQPLLESLSEIEDEFMDHVFLKAVNGENIIGSVRAFMEEDTCMIGKLFVHPDFQNLGIGTQLMQEIERIHDGAGRFELFTGFKSERNIYLYKKLGYKVFKTEKVSDSFELLYFEK